LIEEEQAMTNMYPFNLLIRLEVANFVAAELSTEIAEELAVLWAQ
jgi:hypothetical protein